MTAALSGKRRALVVAGPTCSGKSALALLLAQRFGGAIINADSMQTYRELRVLTARPTPDEEASVPHALYGVRPAAEAGSVAWWRAEAVAAMEHAAAGGRLPILCGGTGLYLASLGQGLAEIPDPGPAARAEARALLAEHAAPGLHALLREADPATASGLRPTDGQRLARAWEVWRGTGRGLAAWQADQTEAPFDWDMRAILLLPPRADLREAIAARFDAMLEHGALAEVRALVALGLDPALPAMRAHGVPELAAYLRGEITLREATTRAVLATGQYTKRQATWFAHRPLVPGPRAAAEAATHRLLARFTCLAQFSDSFEDQIIAFIRERG